MTAGAVVVCTWGGRLDDVEVPLALARKASAGWGAATGWLVLGALPPGAAALAARYGVAAIDQVDDPALRDLRPDACVEAMAQYCARVAPRALLVPQSFAARLLAPRLAGRLDGAVVMNAVELDVDGAGRLRVTAAAYGGDTRAVYEMRGTPAIVAIAPQAVAPQPPAGDGGEAAVRICPADVGRVVERVRVVARAEGASGPRLEDAQVIVAGGRGLGAAGNFHLVQELAEALGGMAGASRPIVDEGWVDSSRQVGLTGTITRPALYIAAGISGASQHMVGCAAARTIVAINRDPEAAVFRYARYGIVGDCLEILPELIRAARARRRAAGERTA